MDPTLEKEILSKAAHDPQAFTPVYAHYYPLILRYFRGRLWRQPEAAADLTSVVFEKALAALSKYEWREFGFGPWLYRIAKNALIDYLRKQQRTPIVITADQEATATADASPEADAELSWQRTRLAQLLGTLPDRDRQIVELKFFQGLNNRQIATMLDVSETNVGTIVYRVLNKLKSSI
jgi:RNA polymerase sigma-70 factor, ECF subfamily